MPTAQSHDNPHADRLRQILATLLSANSDEELQAAKASLGGDGATEGPGPARHARGDLLGPLRYAADGPKRRRGCVMLELPPELADEVLAMADALEEGDLGPGGREGDPHVTSLWGVHDEEADGPDVTQKVAADFGPVTVRLGPVSVFPEADDGQDVVKVELEGDDLHRLHEALKASLPSTQAHPDYKPHITLGYVKAGAGQKYAGEHPLQGHEFTLDRLVFSDSAKDRSRFRLGGDGPLRYAAPRVPGRVRLEEMLGDVEESPAGLEGRSGGQWVAARALAEFYANLFNDLEDAGQPPPDADDVVAELGESHWTLERNPEGRWEAVSLLEGEGDGPTRFARVGLALLYAAVRAPKGGITIKGTFYPGGRFVPGSVVASATGEDRAKLEDAAEEDKRKAKARADARRARGPVNPETLKGRLEPHAGMWLASHQKAQARMALVAVLRHHGGLALHRLEEMAGAVEAALEKVPDDGSESARILRGRLRRRLAQIHWMVSEAHGRGVSGTGEEWAPPPKAPPKPRFTGTDRLGRKWVDGKLVRKDHEPVGGLGGGGEGGGLPAGQQLGAPAGPDAPGGPPGAGGGTPGGGGLAGLPGDADAPGDDGARTDGGRGDAAGDGQGAGPGGAFESSLSEDPTPENPTDVSAGNFRYQSRDFLRPGLKAKFADNVAALRVLEAIAAEGRDRATPEEQEVLSRYCGWGQFKQIFNSYDYDWTRERELLRGLLSPEEWEQARQSTLNAHYTHPDVVDAHWKMAQRLGFAGGRFLETSAGVGYYLGMMPAELAAKTRSSAVEKDAATAKILKLLYPKSDVRHQGFEEFDMPDGFYDLVASNVPFGEWSVHDPRYNKHRANIHDYFFLKSLDKVRPGGVVMHITSAGTLDKPDSKIRQEMMRSADLVAAIRFPGGAHKANAGTEVVTDLVILRKRAPGEAPVDPNETPDEALPQGPGFTGITVDALGRLYHWVDGKRVPGPRWDDLVEVPDPAGGAAIPVNRYFAEHPEQVLGTLDRTGSMYQGETMNVSRTDDYEARLEAAIGRLPEGLMKKARAPRGRFSPEAMPAPGEVKDGGYVVSGGKLYAKDAGRLVEQAVNAKDLARVQGMLSVRDAVRATLNDQLKGQDATASRAALNEAYDAFVAKHGLLNDRANRRAFRADPDAPVLLALERYDADAGTAEKADIFHKDTVRHVESPQKASTVQEAVAISLHEAGRLDVERMAKLLGASPEAVGRELERSGLAFHDPSEGWVQTAVYLSGNVRRKLALAKAAAAADPKYQRNVEALSRVQPEDVPHDEITVKLGASWVPPSDVADFAAFLLEGRAEAFKFNYVPGAGQWQADWSKEYSAKRLERSQQALHVWGTPRVAFMDLFEAALNNTTVSVYDPGPEPGTRELNRQATDDANAKVREMKEAFAGWVWDGDERRQRLHRFYNDNFNNVRLLEYDGQHQSFPGMNPAVNVHPHIKDFVWRVVTTGKGLAAHEVGTGKAQPLDANVLTPTGWKRMGDVRVGDLVIAGDGMPTVVEAVFPQGDKDIYRVVFSDGGSAECCEEHLWLTQTYRERSQAASARRLGRQGWECDKPKARTLAEIRETLVSPHLSAKNHSIPLVGAVQFQPQPVAVPPYVMGVLLGDGSITGGRISVSTADREVAGRVADELPAGLTLRPVPSARRCPEYSIVLAKQSGFGKDRQPNPVAAALAGYGLAGCRSQEKFIPDAYKFNDAATRLAVLQGLLDTDGSVSRRDNSVTYYTVSDRLADDVVFLARSLGGVVRRSMKTPTYVHRGEKRQGKPCHILCLSLPAESPPFRLLRKAEAVRPKTRYRPARYIVAVEPAGRKPAQCIRVAHPSHLYVTDDFAVTHNTYSMIASAMELRRLGLAKKPAIACLKANIEQITKDALHLYPAAKILSTADMFDAAKRKETISRIATGDYDLVILTHDHLDLLQMKPEVVKRYIQEEIQELEAAREESLKVDKSKSNRVAKALTKARERLEARLKEALDPTEKDDAVFFEDLGIDQLFVDEAHKYKSLPVYTRTQGLKGVPTSRSDRATAMQMRTRWLQEQNGGRGVVFATGTPVANTMAELYTVQRYLQPDDLKERGINNFDAWAAAFGDVDTKMEFTVSGEYKPVARFARFVNLPELNQMARQVMDVVRADDLVRPDGSKVIKRPTRKDKVVASPQTDAVADLMEQLKSRAKALKSQKPGQKGADNMLVICTDGRKGALDMRLLDAGAEDHPDSKVNQAVRRVLDLHKADPTKTQLIFSDVGVHPTPGGFHLYGDVIDKLVQGGIPREKIADFSSLEGAKKEAAMEAMRRGEILVGIGSTEKLGTGVNVQNRLAALHHLDVPWLPASVEQRDGRGWRHGNQNKEVGIYRYVTEGSLDQTFWQIIGNKTRFIQQVITGKGNLARTAADDDAEELTPEQLMAAASGDPRILEKVNLDEEVKQLDSSRARHDREQAKFKDQLSAQTRNLGHLESAAGRLRQDAAALEANPDFSFTVGGQAFDKRPEAEAAFKAWQQDNAKEISGGYYPKKVGQYRGFTVGVQQSKFFLESPAGEKYPTGDSLASIEYVARNLSRKAQEADKDVEDARRGLEQLKANIGKAFPKAAELEAKRARARELEAQLKASHNGEERGGGEALPGMPAVSPVQWPAPDEIPESPKRRDALFADLNRRVEEALLVAASAGGVGTDQAMARVKMALGHYTPFGAVQDAAKRLHAAGRLRVKDGVAYAVEAPTPAPTPAPIAKPPASAPATPRPVESKKANTSRGQRYVHGFAPTEAFWSARKAGRLPPNVTVGKNPQTGRWEASIWGADAAEVNDTARRLAESGVHRFARGGLVIRAVAAEASLADQYRRLSAAALRSGDRHSARIYQRQADEEAARHAGPA